MLSQFGHSLYERCVALDLSVQGSREDRFAQKLDPALSQLAADIHAGFHYVAGCIHKWRFRLRAARNQLEQDIADLEARMDEIRHTGIGFSAGGDSARLCRATALKTDCALARATRVETNLAVRRFERQDCGFF